MEIKKKQTNQAPKIQFEPCRLFIRRCCKQREAKITWIKSTSRFCFDFKKVETTWTKWKEEQISSCRRPKNGAKSTSDMLTHTSDAVIGRSPSCSLISCSDFAFTDEETTSFQVQPSDGCQRAFWFNSRKEFDFSSVRSSWSALVFTDLSCSDFSLLFYQTEAEY